MDTDFEAWLEALSQGNPQAAEELWEQHFSSIIKAARQYLKDTPRRVADEEDVALSALNSFVRGEKAGRFQELKDSRELWKLLRIITARKATAIRRRYLSQR